MPCHVLECSALSNTHIQDIFTFVADSVLYYYYNNDTSTENDDDDDDEDEEILLVTDHSPLIEGKERLILFTRMFMLLSV